MIEIPEINAVYTHMLGMTVTPLWPELLMLMLSLISLRAI